MKSELSCFRSQPELQDYQRALENVPAYEDTSQIAAVEDPHFHNSETTVCSHFQLLRDCRADFAPFRRRLTSHFRLSNVTQPMPLCSDPTLSTTQTVLSLLRKAMAPLITQFRLSSLSSSTSHLLQAPHISNSSIIIP